MVENFTRRLLVGKCVTLPVQSRLAIWLVGKYCERLEIQIQSLK
jgi:hypothetical protein